MAEITGKIADEADAFIASIDRRGMAEFGVSGTSFGSTDDGFKFAVMRIIASIQRGNLTEDDTNHNSDEQGLALNLPVSTIDMLQALFFMVTYSYRLERAGYILSSMLDDTINRVYVSQLQIIHKYPERVPYVRAGVTDTKAIDYLIDNDIDTEMARSVYAG